MGKMRWTGFLCCLMALVFLIPARGFDNDLLTDANADGWRDAQMTGTFSGGTYTIVNREDEHRIYVRALASGVSLGSSPEIGLGVQLTNSVRTGQAVFYGSGEADGFLCEHNLEYNTRVGTFTLLVGMELKNAADLISTNRVSLSLIVNGTTYALEQEFVFDLYDEKANATTTTTKAGSTTTTTKQSVTSTTKSGAGSGVTTSSGGSSGSASGSSGGGSSASGSGSGGSASGGSYSSGSGLSSGGVSDGEVVADAAGAEGAEPYDAEVILPNTGSSALGWKSIVALVCAIVVSLAGLGAVGYGLYQRKQEAALEDGEDMEQDTADTLD